MSFWGSFGGRFSSNNSSQLDDLLETDNFNLQQVLDHEEVISECKYMNNPLINYLANKHVIQQLVEYVIAQPPGKPQQGQPKGTEEQDNNNNKDTNNTDNSNPSDNLNDNVDDVGTLPSHDSTSKYPYIASELFACEVGSMLDVLFDDWALLDILFSILDRPPPLDPSHVGYFRKVVQVLIQRKYQSLIEYCTAKGIIDKLVKHIGLYSVMELLIMLGK